MAAPHQAREFGGSLPERFPDPTLARTYDSILEVVGNTPLVRVNHLVEPAGADVYVKLEYFNPGGSAKDRIALEILRGAVESGDLPAGARLVDTGQGNTAVGYVLAGNASGHPVTSVVAPAVSPEKKRLLELLGADLVPGNGQLPADDPENSANVAERIGEEPDTWWARQKSNSNNVLAHQRSTGAELWHQTGGRITHFVAAIATGGTISGTARYLKEQNPDVKIIAAAFQESPNYEQRNLRRVFFKEQGWERLEHDWSPNVDITLIDDLVFLKKADVIDFAWDAIRKEGFLFGLTSALTLKVALAAAKSAGAAGTVVAFAPDGARDYLSREYSAQWLRENELGYIAEKYRPEAEA